MCSSPLFQRDIPPSTPFCFEDIASRVLTIRVLPELLKDAHVALGNMLVGRVFVVDH
jgi:hypothetical protein